MLIELTTMSEPCDVNDCQQVAGWKYENPGTGYVRMLCREHATTFRGPYSKLRPDFHKNKRHNTAAYQRATSNRNARKLWADRQAQGE